MDRIHDLLNRLTLLMLMAFALLRMRMGTLLATVLDVVSLRRFRRRMPALLIVAFAFVGLVPGDADANVNAVRVTKRYADFTASATTKALTIYTTTANQHIWKVVMIRDTDFAGGAVSAATIQVGKSGDTAKYLLDTDVFTGVSNGWANAIVDYSGGMEASGTAIQALLTTTGANTSALTAGVVTFEIYLSNSR